MTNLERYIGDIVFDRKFTDEQKVESIEEWLFDLLDALVDGDECWFDHDGGCQAHGYLSLEPGEKCPQAELKHLLSEAKS